MVKSALFLTAWLLLSGCEQEVTRAQLLANKPTIYGIGIDTERLLHPNDHPNDNELRVFNEFGLPVDSASSEGGAKYLAHPEFYNEVGEKVYAVSNGRVRDIYPLDGENDVLIMVTPDDAELWTIGYEHVSNVQVAVGDQIIYGDYLADFSPQNDQVWTTAEKTALMIFYDNGKGDAENLSICPFDLIHPDYKEAITHNIQIHINDWETQRETDIFDQSKWMSFGCYEHYSDQFGL